MNLNPSDEERITRWIDGELEDAEVEDLLAANPELRGAKAKAGELGNLLRKELDNGEKIPYPDFFNHQLMKHIEDEDQAAAAAGAGPEAYRDLPSGAFFPFLRLSRKLAAYGFLLVLAGFIAWVVFSPGATGSQIVSTYTPNPDIEAKTFYSDEAEATVLLLEGLTEIPAQQEIRGVQLVAYTPSRKTAAVTLSSADARTQFVLIQDRQHGASIREINLEVRRSF